MTRRMTSWALPRSRILGLGSGAANAIVPVAPVYSVFDFTGQRTDCHDGNGQGKAELMLVNYALGTPIVISTQGGPGNFVSFH